MKDAPHLWDTGERVAPETHNSLFLELLSAYEIAKRLFSKGVILDIGCGAGYGASLLADAGHRVVAIDYAPAVAREAARLSRRREVAFACMDGARLGVRPQSVDVACAFQVLEHIPQPAHFLAEVARVLRPAGVAFLSTPNALTHRGPRNPFHTQEFTPKELEGLLGRHFSFVFLAGQRRPVEVYHLEQACRRVRGWDVLGLKRLLPRPLISLIVSLIARMNGLPPPQRMGFRSFPISEDTTHAYSLFALCGHAPYPELASQLAGGS